MKHPLSMGMILLTQTTIVSLTTGFFTYNFWFSYIMFIIMVGGMLVLFIYMTSIASNEMFKYSNNLLMFIMVMIGLTIILFILSDQFFMNNWINSSDSMMILNKDQYNMSFNKYLNFPSNIILFFMIVYLFITLIAVVKITNISYGPLRQSF
uniref:NADH-ubiquinone oxidoreductase chain 6 n=1 Tax=Ptilodactyla sp. PTY01 TaxID=1205576 RepID=A0A0S2MN36_9COLE|nr:NADH deshydrogenase subunit 6 [Ptilodactyla sp. PTY01]